MVEDALARVEVAAVSHSDAIGIGIQSVKQAMELVDKMLVLSNDSMIGDQTLQMQMGKVLIHFNLSKLIDLMMNGGLVMSCVLFSVVVVNFLPQPASQLA